ncbi:alpha/beta-hydrolase, partial [Aureobasidium melanogenum]
MFNHRTAIRQRGQLLIRTSNRRSPDIAHRSWYLRQDFKMTPSTSRATAGIVAISSQATSPSSNLTIPYTAAFENFQHGLRLEVPCCMTCLKDSGEAQVLELFGQAAGICCVDLGILVSSSEELLLAWPRGGLGYCFAVQPVTSCIAVAKDKSGFHACGQGLVQGSHTVETCGIASLHEHLVDLGIQYHSMEGRVQELSAPCRRHFVLRVQYTPHFHRKRSSMLRLESLTLINLIVTTTTLGEVVLRLNVDFFGQEVGVVSIVVDDIANGRSRDMCIYASICHTQSVYVDDSAWNCVIPDSCILIQDIACQAGGPEAAVLCKHPWRKCHNGFVAFSVVLAVRSGFWSAQIPYLKVTFSGGTFPSTVHKGGVRKPSLDGLINVQDIRMTILGHGCERRCIAWPTGKPDSQRSSSGIVARLSYIRTIRMLRYCRDQMDLAYLPGAMKEALQRVSNAQKILSDVVWIAPSSSRKARLKKARLFMLDKEEYPQHRDLLTSSPQYLYDQISYWDVIDVSTLRLLTWLRSILQATKVHVSKIGLYSAKRRPSDSLSTHCCTSVSATSSEGSESMTGPLRPRCSTFTVMPNKDCLSCLRKYSQSHYYPFMQPTLQLNQQEMTFTPKQTRIFLRPRRESDASALFATMSHPDSMQYWSRGQFTSLSSLQDYFSAESTSTSGWKTWAIVKANDSSDTAIGFVAAGARRKGVSEIGYLIAREALGDCLLKDRDELLRIAEWETHIGIRDSLIYGLLVEEWKYWVPRPWRSPSQEVLCLLDAIIQNKKEATLETSRHCSLSDISENSWKRRDKEQSLTEEARISESRSTNKQSNENSLHC